jgi:hypothetical protein
LGNDDEYDDTMGPFIEKIKKIREENPEKIPEGEWAFLKEWETPIVEDKVEVLSERGKEDAHVSSISCRIERAGVAFGSWFNIGGFRGRVVSATYDPVSMTCAPISGSIFHINGLDNYTRER